MKFYVTTTHFFNLLNFMTLSSAYEALVLGGGLNGLSTLYHLTRLGLKKIALLEQFNLFHPYGSSHGESRITRSAYAEAIYVHLMRYAQAEEWPRLEKESGEQLVHPRSGCIFGPEHGLFQKYAQTVLPLNPHVRPLDLPNARQQFPHLRFEPQDAVLQDRTAGVLSAHQTLQALHRLAIQKGATIHENTAVSQVDFSSDPIKIQTTQGTFFTKKLVITAGAWTAQLLPILRSRLNVIRQSVGYFHLDPSPATLPVWIYLGENSQSVYYGLPELEKNLMKCAQHEVQGREDSPKDQIVLPENTQLDHLKEFVRTHFTARTTLANADTCLYTVTATEDFILSPHPNDSRVVIGSGCSGHSFKFGPLTGRILAELLLFGKTTIPEFEAQRIRFAP